MEKMSAPNFYRFLRSLAFGSLACSANSDSKSVLGFGLAEQKTPPRRWDYGFG